MSEENNILNKEEAKKILQRYLGSSAWLAGNFVFLDRNRTNPTDISEMWKSEQIKLEELRRYLGVKEIEGRYDQDNHLGQLSTYAWLKIGYPNGGGFSPIFDAISRVKEKYPAEEERLESISRRLAFLCFLKREMEYMNKRYDYEEIPIIFEFYSNKLEVFTTLLVDLLLILGIFLYDQPGHSFRPDRKPERFADVLDCFEPLEKAGHSFFNSLNVMLELSAAVSTRHNYVHDIGPKVSLTNDGGAIEFEIPKDHRIGEFQRYMQDMPRFFGFSLPTGEITEFRDPRFPAFEYSLRRGRKGTFDYDGSTVGYKSSVPQYVDMLERLLAIICQAVFATVLSS
ncbi:MAG: hypothetical protein ACXAAO_11515 [Candidatus Thorarchaeota archaeon]|jgi:hypothetical protein